MKKKIIAAAATLLCSFFCCSAFLADGEYYSTSDLLLKSELTESQLNENLKGDFQGKAHLFLTAEEETGVNAVLIASLAALESGWGKYPNSQNNYFGWYGDTYYTNADDSILDVAQRIKELYLSESGAYFSGYGVRDVNEYYSESSEWSLLVEEMMAQIGCID